jgi:two-component system chemotaxis response regulator CheB
MVKMVSRIKVITHLRGRLAGNRELSAPTIGQPVHSGKSGGRLVAIGTSTGGPASLAAVLGSLQPGFPWPVLVVIHIGKPFALAFTQWLGEQTTLPVSLAKGGEALSAVGGQVLVAPTDTHMVVRGDHLVLTDEAPIHSCRPSVDALFSSVASEIADRSIACLLTGMGRDGADGLLAIRKSGGHTVAQNEATSVVFGMPREAINRGAAEYILPLEDIGPHLARLAQVKRKK